jgi:hypothetical protein
MELLNEKVMLPFLKTKSGTEFVPFRLFQMKEKT